MVFLAPWQSTKYNKSYVTAPLSAFPKGVFMSSRPSLVVALFSGWCRRPSRGRTTGLYGGISAKARTGGCAPAFLGSVVGLFVAHFELRFFYCHGCMYRRPFVETFFGL